MAPRVVGAPPVAPFASAFPRFKLAGADPPPDRELVRVCLDFMRQIGSFWEACKARDQGSEGGRLVLEDSREALETLLATETRLQGQLQSAVRSVVEWCRLANACVQGMQAWELADRGESIIEMKGKREMFNMLRKLHQRVSTAVSMPGSNMVATGMPVSEQSADEDENIEHLMLVLARTNVEYTQEALKYVGAISSVDATVLEQLTQGMDMMRQGMEETGSCLQRLAEEVREAARLYEASAELLGGVGEDAISFEWEREGPGMEQTGEGKGRAGSVAAGGALRGLVDLHRIVDALL